MQADQIDWGQFWYPGPKRVFTQAELATAGSDRPGATLVAAALFNYALLALLMMLQAPQLAIAPMTGLLVLLGLLFAAGSRRLWRAPSRRGLARWTLAGTLLMMVSSIVACEVLDAARGSPLRGWLLTTGLGGALLLSILWWFLVIFRAHQIEARLREIADQQQALDMARQLAAAQIQPHFLFNSLASLQHWVHTKDDRAAPLLDALTGFLRATLPLFNRERLALGDEAAAVQQYLAVTGLRLGERLRWSLQISPQVQAEQVPPGLLLTLVENAVEHGVQASLSGGNIDVRALRQGGRVVVEVQDSGPGPAPGAVDGVGLANSRARLQQAFGAQASLVLSPAPGGGCLARVEWPSRPGEPVAAARSSPSPPTSLESPQQ